MAIRHAEVAGQFYPASGADIRGMIDRFNDILEKTIIDKRILEKKSKALIVPHAGYIYSGFTSNVAYRLLANSGVKRVVVMGPSHRIYLKGTSVGKHDIFETPLGNILVDKAFAEELIDRFELGYSPKAHFEHSTEVQMPFIKMYLSETKVVELVYGDEEPKKLASLIKWLLEDELTGVVVSTDLSHYYDLKRAKAIDSKCVEAVSELDPVKLDIECEACGKRGLEALLIAAKESLLKPIILDYRTSADTSGDETQVVGYLSAAFL